MSDSSTGDSTNDDLMQNLCKVKNIEIRNLNEQNSRSAQRIADLERENLRIADLVDENHRGARRNANLEEENSRSAHLQDGSLFRRFVRSARSSLTRLFRCTECTSENFFSARPNTEQYTSFD